MMKTTPRLDTDVCALNDEHDLPEMVTLYGDDQEMFWMGRTGTRVVCSETEADEYTDQLVFATYG
jgi:hypothetical protein